MRENLALGHAAVDLILAGSLLLPVSAPWSSSLTELRAQETAGVTFDLRNSTACFHNPSAQSLMIVGTLPAAILALWLLPCAHVDGRELQLWIAIYLVTSAAFWFAWGWAYEKSRVALPLGLRFLQLRGFSILSLPFGHLQRVFSLAQILWWWFAIVALTVIGFRKLRERMSTQ